jgi:hypothetical protein
MIPCSVSHHPIRDLPCHASGRSVEKRPGRATAIRFGSAASRSEFDRWRRGEPVRSYETKWVAYLKSTSSKPRALREERDWISKGEIAIAFTRASRFPHVSTGVPPVFFRCAAGTRLMTEV